MPAIAARTCSVAAASTSWSAACTTTASCAAVEAAAAVAADGHLADVGELVELVAQLVGDLGGVGVLVERHGERGAAAPRREPMNGLNSPLPTVTW